MNSLRFDDMAALTGCEIDFATACAAPDRALRTARRSYPAGAFGSEDVNEKPWQRLHRPRHRPQLLNILLHGAAAVPELSDEEWYLWDVQQSLL